MPHVYTIGKYLGHEGSEELIDAAIKGPRGAAKDKENGGWFSTVTPDGGHVENKLCYVHAFVILAASDAVLAEYPEGKELLRMHWIHMTAISGMKRMEWHVIHGIQNLLSWIRTED